MIVKNRPVSLYKEDKICDTYIFFVLREKEINLYWVEILCDVTPNNRMYKYGP